MLSPLAFTATASQEVLAKIRQILFPSGGESLVAGGADRPNIFYRVLPVLSRWHALHEAVRSAARPALVFCRTREGTEAGARLMRLRFPGQSVFFYHAGLDREELQELLGRLQRRWAASEVVAERVDSLRVALR